MLLPQTIKTCLKSVSSQTKKETDSLEVNWLFDSNSDRSSLYIVCKLTFICSDAKAHEIKIDVKKGIEAKNYDEQVTLHFEHWSRITFIFRPKRKNWSHWKLNWEDLKIFPIPLSTVKSNDLYDTNYIISYNLYHKILLLTINFILDFQYMKQREEEMRSTNESTNSRVLYFSIFSMLCLGKCLYSMTLFKFKGTVLKIPRLSSFLAEQRFYMEEDRKGRGREKSPLSFNIIAAQLRLNST